jgi:hypothetical protein
MMKSCKCTPEVFFASQHATAIVDNIDAIISSDPHDKKLLERVIGGQFFDGQVDCLAQAIISCITRPCFQQFLTDRANYDMFISSECIQLKKAKEAHAAEVKSLAAAQAAEKRKQAKLVKKQTDNSRVRLNALQLFTPCTPIWSGKVCTPIFLEWEAVYSNIFGVDNFPLQKFSLLKAHSKNLECT